MKQSTEIVRQVERFIGDNAIVAPGEKVIVALSGGADSVALLLLMVELGFDCSAMHCNFGLRGVESERDESFVRQLCSGLGISCSVRRFDVPARRGATGESVEMACRELRYEWFEQVRRQAGHAVIAVGHHLEDNVETLMLNMVRGAGVAGVAGMRPRRDNIVRPLLECSRQQIEEYLRDKGAGWIHDSSNDSDDYRRNRVRHHLLPALDIAFDGALPAIGRTLSHLRQGADFFADSVKRVMKDYQEPSGALDVARLVGCEPHSRLLLHETLRPLGFTSSMVDSLMAASPCHSGRWFHTPSGRSYLLDRGRLVEATPGESRCVEVSLDGYPFLMEMVTGEIDRHVDPRVAYFSPCLLEGNPRFELRSWRVGDKIAPFGMKGAKKVSDLFRDLHVADSDKLRPVILTRNDEIIWVVGMRHSRLFSVGCTGSPYIKLTFVG